jgi:hypothetical protein
MSNDAAEFGLPNKSDFLSLSVSRNQSFIFSYKGVREIRPRFKFQRDLNSGISFFSFA